MPDEDKTFSGSLVLDIRIWWRHLHTLYWQALKIQNGRYKMQNTRDEGRSNFYSYSKRIKGLSMLYLSLMSDQVGLWRCTLQLKLRSGFYGVFSTIISVFGSVTKLFGVFEILVNTHQFDTILLKADSYVLLTVITSTVGRVFARSSGVKLLHDAFATWPGNNQKKIQKIEKVNECHQPTQTSSLLLYSSPEVRH